MFAVDAGDDPLAILDGRLRSGAAEMAPRFRAAEPFPHLIIDGLLGDDACRRLAAEFPPFERGNSLDENGRPGGKAVFENVRALGPAFTALDDLVRSPEFLTLLGAMTGVSGLVYDPDYLGGGTHENRVGQRLDFHVDFNRHPRGWDRRLNILFYLNTEWDPAWGGCLELRGDPRTPAPPILPVFNRAVLFETTDRSWHGFSTIRPGAPTRRSVALYFYTRELRATPHHSTMYVEEPLDPRAPERAPELIARRGANLTRLEGRTHGLLETLRMELAQAIATGARLDPATVGGPIDLVDREMARLFAYEIELRQALERVEALPRVPWKGRVRAVSQAGFWHDAWAGPRLVARGLATGAVDRLIIRGDLPKAVGRQELRFGTHTQALEPGYFEWEVPLEASPGDAVSIEIVASSVYCPRRAGESDDSRELAWMLRGLEARGP